MTVDFSNRYTIISLPCGCVIETSAWANYLTTTVLPDGIVECMWCSATFESASFNQWFATSAPPIMMQNRPKVVFKFGGMVLEAAGRCERCNEYLVRQGGGKEFHLDSENARASEMKWLKN